METRDGRLGIIYVDNFAARVFNVNLVYYCATTVSREIITNYEFLMDQSLESAKKLHYGGTELF